MEIYFSYNILQVLTEIIRLLIKCTSFEFNVHKSSLTSNLAISLILLLDAIQNLLLLSLSRELGKLIGFTILSSLSDSL